MSGTWEALKRKHLSPERIRKAKKEAERMALELDLRALRVAAGKTQVEMAPAMEMTQSELSRLERREDIRLSTLHRYVHALGGRIKVVAEVGKKKIVLAEG